MSNRFRKMVYLVVGAAALVAVYIGVISTPWVQRYLERRMIRELEASTGARVEIRDFQFRPVILQFILHDLVLRGKEPASSPAMFSAKTVVIQLSPRAIIEWKPLFRSLDWDEAEIHLSTNPDGTTNLPDLPRLVEAGGSVGRLTLARTKLFWNERRLRADLSAGDVAVLIRRNPAGDYSGSLSTSGVKILNPTLSLPSVSFSSHFDLSETGVQTRTLTWQSAGLSGHGKLSIANWHSPELNFAYEAAGDVKELAGILRVGEFEGGRFESQGTIAYFEHKLEAQGKLQIRQLALRANRAALEGVSVATDFSGKSDQILFTNIAGTALEGRFQGSGTISLAGPAPKFLFRTRVDNVSLGRVQEALGAVTSHVPFSSQASGPVVTSWEGAFRDFRSDFSIELRPRAGDRPQAIPLSGHLNGTARLAPDLVFEIAQADLRTRASEVSARGTVGARHADLAVQLSIADFEEWRPIVEQWVESKEPIPLKLRSAVRFRGQLSGPIRGVQLQGQITSAAFEFRETKWDSLRADVTLSPEIVRVASGRLEFEDSQLHWDGAIPLKAWRLDSEEPLHLTVNAEKTPLEGLIKAIDVDFPLSGNLSGRLDLGGTAGNSTGTGHLQVEDGILWGEPFDSLSTQIRVDHSVWRFIEVVWTKGRGGARGEGEIAFPTRNFRMSMTGKDFRLNELQRLRSSPETASTLKLQGLLNFGVQAQGRPDDVVMDATVTVQDIATATSPLGDLFARLDWRGQRIAVEGGSKGPGGTIRFSGSGPSNLQRPLEIKGEYSSLRLDPWIQLLSARKSTPQLTASGSFQANVPLKKPDALELWTQTQDLAIKYPDLAWNSAGPVAVHYIGNRLTLERFRLLGPATNLEVEGSIQFGQGGSLSLLAEGNAEATLLSLLDPALQANGVSVLKVRIAGSVDRPTIHGTLKIQDVNVGYGDLPVRITGLRGDIALEGERATLRSLRGASGGGIVTLNGFLAFGSVPRFNVQADLNQVRLRYPSDFTSLLDGSLRLAGSAERGQISGDLIVRQIFPPENFNWLVRVGEAGTSAGLARSAIHSPIAPRIRLNVRVSSASAMRFETRDLRLVADIDMRVQGTLADPVEVGTIQILSGEAVFRGNRYAIERGEISMPNPFRTERVLAMEARTRIQRYDLAVNISGPFSRLKITYRSDPPLPAADIVTLLAFGYARQQEEMATGATHPIATVGASALLSQALSTQVSGRIQRLFGVSRIKIDPNVGGIGATSGARITVEQQVAPELTITYVTSAGTSQYRIIRLEWAVTDRVSIIGERDQGGILGMEVHFRQRFR